MSFKHTTSPVFPSLGREMGELIYNKDWSDTIGPSEAWPVSLRITLNTMLSNKFPMFLFWGEDLLCFYNDAYRFSLGNNGKHPSILGMKGSEAWKETWDVIYPYIECVMTECGSIWKEDLLIPIYRNGKLEDVYWTFAYSPLIDENNTIRGVLVTCYETTEKVAIRESLKESRDQLQFAVDAAGLATWEYNPGTKLFKSNNRLKNWFSLSDKEENHLDEALQVIVEDDRQRVINAIEYALMPESGGSYMVTYTVRNPSDGDLRKVRAIGKVLFNEENKPYLFSGIIQDITEEIALLSRYRSSEEYIRKLIDTAPFPLAVYRGKEMIIEYANKSLLQTWGKGNDVIGKRFIDVLPEMNNQGVLAQLNEVFETGVAYHAINRMVNIVMDGVPRDFYFNYSYTPLFDESGNVFAIMNTAADVTEINLATRRIEESERRFRDAVQQAPFGIAILRGPDYVVELANENYLKLIGKKEKQLIGQPLFNVLENIEEVITPLFEKVYREGLVQYGIEFPVMLNRYGKTELTYFNFVYHPLREQNGEVTGVMVVATEVTGFVNARLQLENSERQFRSLVMKSPTPMTVLRGEDFIVEMANQKMIESIWRRAEDEVIGKKLIDLFPELKIQKYPEILMDVIRTGRTYKNEESVAYISGRDGLRKFYLDFECGPVFENETVISGIILTINDVTEKVEARKKLEESESRFRNIADNAPVFIWMANAEGKYIFFNKAWLNFKGASQEQETASGIITKIHPDDIARREEVFANAWQLKEDFYIDYRIMRKDGEYRWITESAVPRFTLEGDFEGYIGACKDIHERVMNRQRLKDNEERLNIVIGASELGTWELNLETSEIFYSERYLEILGYEKGTILTHHQIVKHLHPDDLYIRESAFRTAFATGSLNYQSRIIWNNGTIHWIEGKGKVFYDDSMKPVKMIGTVRDITDEINYQRQLEEREQKFRLLADSMPQHIWTADTYGNMNYFNQSIYNYTGYTFEQLVNDGWLDIIHPDDRSHSFRLWKKAVSEGTDFNCEHRFRRKDGTYRWQLTRAIPQTDHTGAIQMWVGTSTDIQDQKEFTSELESQVEERTRELELKNRELQKMNGELQSFAYVSSHDLQEPLRKIQTFAARILDKEKANLTDTGKDYFRRMQDAAGRMQTLIDDLLAYSRTNTTDNILHVIDLREFMTEIKNEFRDVLAEKNAEMVIDVSGEIRVITFQFRQLLQNIIGNAIKFAARSRKPEIKVTSEYINGDISIHEALNPQIKYCHLSISDNGIGFDPVYSERIFEVFQRLHGREEFSGTGIGLAIVKKIMDNHSGVVKATGKPGEGAVFDLYIPVDL